MDSFSGFAADYSNLTINFAPTLIPPTLKLFLYKLSKPKKIQDSFKYIWVDNTH